MTSKKAVVEQLTQDQKNLENYGVASLSIFGSYAKGTFNPSSDIDILVTFNKPVGLFEFMRLQDHLEGVLGVSVDLVTKEALHPQLKSKILKDLIHVI